MHLVGKRRSGGFLLGVLACAATLSAGALTGCASPDPTALDFDGDGTPDVYDAFPVDPAEQDDTDGDGVGNNADSDDDNDGLLDVDDPNPLDPNMPTPESP